MDEAQIQLAKNMDKVSKAAAAVKASPKPKGKPKVNPKMQPSAGYAEEEQASPTSSWQDIPLENRPVAFNPMDHLTEEEKKHIYDLASSRVQVIPNTEEEMEPDYGNP